MLYIKEKCNFTKPNLFFLIFYTEAFDFNIFFICILMVNE